MSKLSELQQVFRKLLPLLVIGISGVATLPVSNSANAQTRLTRAVIQDLQNLVQLMPQRQPRRRAQRSDAMTPGDGLSTGRLSLADLRFNDGSLTRVGEQAVFKFLPQTRNFTLNNGTVLLLIPPGRGRTNIRTPSAAAAIRGSALFVRYDKATDTTVVGALTNSGIEVFDKDASRSKVLQAGQMMVVVKGKFQQLYDFDLRTFYDTSDLVRGLDLTRQNPNATSDPALDSVRAETSEALSKQVPISGPGTIKDPSFIKLTTTPEETSDTSDTALGRESDKVDSILDNSQIQQNSNQRNNRNNSTTESGNNSEAPTNVPNPSVTLPQQQPGTGTVTTPIKPEVPSVTAPPSPGTGSGTTPIKPEVPSVTAPPSPGTGSGTTPIKPEVPSVTAPPSPGTGSGTTPIKPEVPSVTAPPSPGTGSGTTPIKPEVPSVTPSPAPGSGTIPIKPEVPSVTPSPAPGSGTIPIKPEVPPVTPPPAPDTGTIPIKPEVPPVTPPPSPGTGTIPTKPEVPPVTPPITKPDPIIHPPSDATTDPSTRPST